MKIDKNTLEITVHLVREVMTAHLKLTHKMTDVEVEYELEEIRTKFIGALNGLTDD